jgi:hypothetical protein
MDDGVPPNIHGGDYDGGYDPYTGGYDGGDDYAITTGAAEALGGSDILGGCPCVEGGSDMYGGMESQLNLKTEAILFIDAVLVVFVVILIAAYVWATYSDSKVPANVRNAPDYKSAVSSATSIPLHIVGGLVVARLVVGAAM